MVNASRVDGDARGNGTRVKQAIQPLPTLTL